MPEYTIETAIAPGWNNAAGLALITSLSASSIPFLDVSTAGDYEEGEEKFKSNGVTGYSGFPSLIWTSGLLWLPQWKYLRTNYAGPVTIRTWTDSTAYANFNAILRVPQLRQFDKANETRYGHAVIDFTWIFTIKAAL